MGSSGKVHEKGVQHNFAVVRYKPDGSLDNSFGTDGKVTTTFGTEFSGANAVALQTDGKAVVVGSGYVESYDFTLARYKPDGTLDPSFGTGGEITTDFPGYDDDVAYAVAVAPNGGIIAAGTGAADEVLSSKFALARYLPRTPHCMVPG